MPQIKTLIETSLKSSITTVAKRLEVFFPKRVIKIKQLYM